VHEDSGSQTADLQSEGEREDYLIAWVRGKLYADKESVKRDLRELSDKAGFDITRFEVSYPYEDSTGIVKAYTDTYPKIPEEKKNVVNNWMSKVCWSQTIVDVHVKVRNRSFETVGVESEKTLDHMEMLEMQQKEINDLREEVEELKDRLENGHPEPEN